MPGTPREYSRLQYNPESKVTDLKTVNNGVTWTLGERPQERNLPVVEEILDIYCDKSAARTEAKTGTRKITTLDEIEAVITLQAEDKSTKILQGLQIKLNNYMKTMAKSKTELKKKFVTRARVNSNVIVNVTRVSATLGVDGGILGVTFHYSDFAKESSGFNPTGNAVIDKGFTLEKKEHIIELKGFGDKKLAAEIIFLTNKGNKYRIGSEGKGMGKQKFAFKASAGYKIVGIKGNQVNGIKEAPITGSRNRKASTDEKSKAGNYKRLHSAKEAEMRSWMQEFKREREDTGGLCGICFTNDDPKNLEEEYERQDKFFLSKESEAMQTNSFDPFAKEHLQDVCLRTDYREKKIQISTFDHVLGKAMLPKLKPKGGVEIDPVTKQAVMHACLAYSFRHRNLSEMLLRITQLVMYSDAKEYGRYKSAKEIFGKGKGEANHLKVDEQKIYTISQNESGGDPKRFGVTVLHVLRMNLKEMLSPEAKLLEFETNELKKSLYVAIEILREVHLTGEDWNNLFILDLVKIIGIILTFSKTLPDNLGRMTRNDDDDEKTQAPTVHDIHRVLVSFAEDEKKSKSLRIHKDLSTAITALSIQFAELETSSDVDDPATHIMTEMKKTKLKYLNTLQGNVFIGYLLALEKYIPDIVNANSRKKTSSNTVTIGQILQVPEGEASTSHCQINGREVVALRGTPIVFADQVALNNGRWYYEVEIVKIAHVRVGWFRVRSGESPDRSLDIQPGLGSDQDGFGLDVKDMSFWRDGVRVNSNIDMKSAALAPGSIIGCEIFFGWEDVNMNFYHNGNVCSRQVIPKKNISKLSPAMSVSQGGCAKFRFSQLQKLEYVPIGYLKTFSDPMAEEKKSEGKSDSKEKDPFWVELLEIQATQCWHQIHGNDVHVPPELESMLSIEFTEAIPEYFVQHISDFLKKLEGCMISTLLPIMQRYIYFGVKKQTGKDGKRFEEFFRYTDKLISLCSTIMRCSKESKHASKIVSQFRQLPLLRLLSPFVCEIGFYMQYIQQLPSIGLRILPNLVRIMEDFYAILPHFDWENLSHDDEKYHIAPEHMFLPQMIAKVCCEFNNGLIATQKYSLLEVKNKWWLESGLFSGGLAIGANVPVDHKVGQANNVWKWCPELCTEFINLKKDLKKLKYHIQHRDEKQEFWERSFLGEIFRGEGKAGALIKKIQKRKRTKQVRKQHGGEKTLAAVRAVFACLLKHCHLEKMAKDSADKGTRFKPPLELMNLWADAFKIALVARNLFNKEEAILAKYGSLPKFLDLVTTRARFLLVVSPCTHGPESSEMIKMSGIDMDIVPASKISSLKEESKTDEMPVIVRQKSNPNSKWKKVKALMKLRLLGQVTRRLRDIVQLRKQLIKQTVSRGSGIADLVTQFVMQPGETDLGREICECLVRQRIRATYRIAALGEIHILAKAICKDNKEGQSENILLTLVTFLAQTFTPGSVNALLHEKLTRVTREKKKPALWEKKGAKPQTDAKSLDEMPEDDNFRYGDEIIVHGLVVSTYINNRRGKIVGNKLNGGRYPCFGKFNIGSISECRSNFKPENLWKASRFAVGNKVRIKGLKNSFSLNGRVGKIVAPILKNNRVPLQLTNSNKVHNVLPSNLTVLKKEVASVAVAMPVAQPELAKTLSIFNRSRFLQGDKVKVQGLKSSQFATINGKEGIIAGAIQFNGRYPVIGNWRGITESKMNFKPNNLVLVERSDGKDAHKVTKASHYLSQLEVCGLADSHSLCSKYYSTIQILLNHQASSNAQYILQLTASLNLEYEHIDVLGLVKANVAESLQRFLPFYILPDQKTTEEEMFERSFLACSCAWNAFRLLVYYGFVNDYNSGKHSSKELKENAETAELPEMNLLRDSVMNIIFSRLLVMMDKVGLRRTPSSKDEPLPQGVLKDEIRSCEQSLADASVSWYSLQTRPMRGMHYTANILAAINQFLWVILRCSSTPEGQTELSQRCWIQLLSRVFYFTADHHKHGQWTTQLLQVSQTLVSRIFQRCLKLSPTPPEMVHLDEQKNRREYHSQNTVSNDLIGMWHRIGVFSLPLPFSPTERQHAHIPLELWNVVVSHKALMDLRRDLESAQACSSVVEDIVYLFRSLMTPIRVNIALQGGIQNTTQVFVYLGESVWSMKKKVGAPEALDVDPVGLTLLYNFKEMKRGLVSDFKLVDNCTVDARIEDTKENKELAQSEKKSPTSLHNWADRIEDILMNGLRLIKPTLNSLEKVAKYYEKIPSFVDMKDKEKEQAREIERSLESIYAALTVLGGTISRIREGGKVKFKSIGENAEIGHVSSLHFVKGEDKPLPDRVLISVGTDDGQSLSELTIGDVYAIPDVEMPYSVLKNKEEVVDTLKKILELKCPPALASLESGTIHFLSIQRRILKIVSEMLKDQDFRRIFKNKDMMALLHKFSDQMTGENSVATLELKEVLLESIQVPCGEWGKTEEEKKKQQKDFMFGLSDAFAKMVKSLMSMGFDGKKARKALENSKWDVNNAINWMFMHGEDDDSEDEKAGGSSSGGVGALRLLGAKQSEIDDALESAENSTRNAIIELVRKKAAAKSNSAFVTVSKSSKLESKALSMDPRFHILANPQAKMAFDESSNAPDSKASSPSKTSGGDGESDLFLEKGSEVYQPSFSLAKLRNLSRSEYLRKRIQVEKGLSAAYARRSVAVFFEYMDMGDNTVLKKMISEGTVTVLLESLSKEGSGFEGIAGPFQQILKREAQDVCRGKNDTPLTDILVSQMILSLVHITEPLLKNSSKFNELEKAPISVVKWIINLFVGTFDFIEGLINSDAMAKRRGFKKAISRKEATPYYSKVLPTECWNVMLELINGASGAVRTEAILLFSSLAKSVPTKVFVQFPKYKVKSLFKKMNTIYDKQKIVSDKAKGSRFSPFLQSLVELNVNVYLLSSISDRESKVPNWFQDVVYATECMEAFSRGDGTRTLPDHFLMQIVLGDKRTQNQVDFLSKFLKTNTERFNEKLDEELVLLIDTRDAKREPSAKKKKPFIEEIKLLIDKGERHNYPDMTEAKITYEERKHRFLVLKKFNTLMKSVLPLVNLSLSHGISRMTDLVKATKSMLFWGTKEQIWRQALLSSVDQRFKTKQTKLLINPFDANDLKEQKAVDWQGTRSQFGQAFRQLNSKPGYFWRRPSKGVNRRAFQVIFKKLFSHDEGGCYRDHITSATLEIESYNLPLFVKCPNARLQMGKNREIWVPRSMKGLQMRTRENVKSMYEFLGKLMGLAIRTTIYLALNFSAVTWKPMCREKVTLQDVSEIDELIINQMKMMNELKEEEFNKAMASSKQTFQATLTDEKTVELIPDGKKIPVTWSNKERYLQLLTKIRTTEFKDQCAAMLRGLATVVPYQLVTLFKWTDLRDQVCGTVEIDLKLLKAMTIYAGDDRKNKRINASSSHVKHFWTMMGKMTNEERSKVLFFVWGRTRLPPNKESFGQKFMIKACKPAQARGKKPDDFLPISHTCFFQLELPEYSNPNIMKTQVLKACAYCKEIDGDNTTAARNAANMG